MTVFHRGGTPAPSGAQEIRGNRNQLAEFRDRFRQEKFDAVVDFILSSGRQAEQLMDVFRGITGYVVALSSMDVYRAWGVFYGSEPGGLQELPVTEESAVRTVRQSYPPAVLKRLQAIFGWFDDEYDKVAVEQTVLGDRELQGTLLRLPMIYGPGDPTGRFHPYLKRMDDQRPFILFADDAAAMRTPRGFVEDVAAGIALAVTSGKARGRMYNICEAETFSELEWARKIAAAVGWTGEFIVLPHEKTPPHLYWPGNTAQHLVVSSERIRRELGYDETTRPEAAFRRTIAWERNHPPKVSPAQFLYKAEDEAVAGFRRSA